MANFRDALEGCELVDIGHRGEFFTWSNKHSDDTFTKERLDRSVVNHQWLQMLSEFWVESLVAWSSDHRPILIVGS